MANSSSARQEEVHAGSAGASSVGGSSSSLGFETEGKRSGPLLLGFGSNFFQALGGTTDWKANNGSSSISVTAANQSDGNIINNVGQDRGNANVNAHINSGGSSSSSISIGNNNNNNNNSSSFNHPISDGNDHGHGHSDGDGSGTMLEVGARIFEYPPWESRDGDHTDELIDIQCSTTATLFLTFRGRIYQVGILHGLLLRSPMEVPIPLPSRKVVQIACGRHSCFALVDCSSRTGDSRRTHVVLAWGAGHFGQLGLGPQVSVAMQPTLIQGLLPQAIGGGETIVAIAAGAWHAGAITTSGRLFMWGSNRRYQCGHKSPSTLVVPQPISNPTSSLTANNPDAPPVRFQKISLGKQHTLGLSIEGKVYAWGANVACGHMGGSASNKKASSASSPRGNALPKLVETLKSVAIVDIAAGEMHSLALTGGGRVFGWGSNQEGQLGIPSSSTVNSSTTTATASAPVATPTATASTPSSSTNGNGNTNTKTVMATQANYLQGRPKLLGDLDFVAIVAKQGWWLAKMQEQQQQQQQQHSIAGTTPSSKDLLSFASGSNHKKLSSATSKLLPKIPRITSIFAFGSYSLAKSSVGHVYAWGYNDMNVLGIPPQPPAEPLSESLLQAKRGGLAAVSSSGASAGAATTSPADASAGVSSIGDDGPPLQPPLSSSTQQQSRKELLSRLPMMMDFNPSPSVPTTESPRTTTAELKAPSSSVSVTSNSSRGGRSAFAVAASKHFPDRLAQVQTFDSRMNVLIPTRLDCVGHLEVKLIGGGPSHLWIYGKPREQPVMVGRTLYEIEQMKLTAARDLLLQQYASGERSASGTPFLSPLDHSFHSSFGGGHHGTDDDDKSSIYSVETDVMTTITTITTGTNVSLPSVNTEQLVQNYIMRRGGGDVSATSTPTPNQSQNQSPQAMQQLGAQASTNTYPFVGTGIMPQQQEGSKGSSLPPFNKIDGGAPKHDAGSYSENSSLTSGTPQNERLGSALKGRASPPTPGKRTQFASPTITLNEPPINDEQGWSARQNSRIPPPPPLEAGETSAAKSEPESNTGGAFIEASPTRTKRANISRSPLPSVSETSATVLPISSGASNGDKVSSNNSSNNDSHNINSSSNPATSKPSVVSSSAAAAAAKKPPSSPGKGGISPSPQSFFANRKPTGGNPIPNPTTALISSPNRRNSNGSVGSRSQGSRSQSTVTQPHAGSTPTRPTAAVTSAELRTYDGHSSSPRRRRNPVGRFVRKLTGRQKDGGIRGRNSNRNLQGSDDAENASLPPQPASASVAGSVESSRSSASKRQWFGRRNGGRDRGGGR